MLVHGGCQGEPINFLADAKWVDSNRITFVGRDAQQGTGLVRRFSLSTSAMAQSMSPALSYAELPNGHSLTALVISGRTQISSAPLAFTDMVRRMAG